MMRVSRSSKGFTLIELLIVVAIIGILAAIAIPAYSGYTAKSKVAGVVHTMGALKNAILAYYTEVGPQAGNVFAVAVPMANISTILNVSPSNQYASYAVATNGTITATFGTPNAANNIAGIAAGNTLVLTPATGADPWTWAWSGTGAAANYVPKGN